MAHHAAIVVGSATCDSIEVDELELSEGFKFINGEKFRFFQRKIDDGTFGAPPGILFLLSPHNAASNSYEILQLWKAAGLVPPG
jgi:hypothetical protein